jgi:hypothetical protein
MGEKSRGLWAYTPPPVVRGWSNLPLPTDPRVTEVRMNGTTAARKCDDCNRWYAVGDWPFCGGDPEGHRR